MYRPPIIRVGEGASPAVRTAGVWLDALVDDVVERPHKELSAIAAQLIGERTAIVDEIDRVRRGYQAEVLHLRSGVQVAVNAGTLTVNAGREKAAGLQRQCFHRAAARLVGAVSAYEKNRARSTRVGWALGLAGLSGSERSAQFAAVRREVRNSLLEGAEVVLTTTSSAAVGTIESFVQETGHGFDIVIVDEAAQAAEPSTLIPLKYGCSQCILVGDPRQLPATILSRAASSAGYDRSLFERMVEAGHPAIMLDTQYRSHPAIAAFPSAHFYGGRLKDALSVTGAGRAHPMHSHPAFRPFVLYNLRTARQDAGHEEKGADAAAETTSGSAGSAFSSSNSAEAVFVLRLIDELAQWQSPAPPPAATAASASTDANIPSTRPASTPAATASDDAAAGHVSASVDQHMLPAMSTQQQQQRIQVANAPAGQPFTGSVGVITFYRNQELLLRRALTDRYDLSAVDASASCMQPNGVGGGGPAMSGKGLPAKPRLPFAVDINTVDGFQGQERDVIILSCVRTIDTGVDGLSCVPRASDGSRVHSSQASTGQRGDSTAAMPAPAMAMDMSFESSAPSSAPAFASVASAWAQLGKRSHLAKSEVENSAALFVRDTGSRSSIEEGVLEGPPSSTLAAPRGSSSDDSRGGDNRSSSEASCANDALDRIATAAATTASSSATAAALSNALVVQRGASTSNSSSRIGFVDDPKRMNVALTRARYACWVVGHAPALCTSTHWRALVRHARREGCEVVVDDVRMSRLA